jgi:hypothetical protein
LNLSTRRYLSVAFVCGLSLGFGCGDDDTAKSTGDAAVGGAGGSAGSSGHAGQGGHSGSGGSGGAKLGSTCLNDADCGKLFCDRENKQSVPVTGAPGGAIDETLFPGGSCTPKPLTMYDPTGGSSCDPSEPNGAQGCGTNGVCSIESQSSTSAEVACRVACDPSNTSTGCDRDGYTCDFSAHDCVPSCRVDAECRLLSMDSNGDGVPEYAYDTQSRAVCDQTTGRCTHSGGSATIGAACQRSEDCSGDSICIADGTDVEGQDFPDGFCTRRGCDISGRDCESGSVCESLRPGANASATEVLCLTRCTVGAEPSDLRLGPSGHGAGCRAGYACRYNGGPGAESGACVGGVYNAVTTNNIGSACKSSDDCYSPYGAGTCLSYGLPDGSGSPGICTVLDCYSPGLPDDLCGSGNECIGAGADQSQCAHTCKSANDCPTGYACADDDSDTTTAKTCYPVCLTDDDCRSNQTCKLYAGEMVGACTGR